MTTFVHMVVDLAVVVEVVEASVGVGVVITGNIYCFIVLLKLLSGTKNTISRPSQSRAPETNYSNFSRSISLLTQDLAIVKSTVDCHHLA